MTDDKNATGDKAPKPEPKKAAPAAKAPGRTGGRRPGSPNKRNMTGELESLLASVGLVLSLVSPADGSVVMANVPNVAGALNTLADQDPRVRKLLIGLTASNAWGGLAVALAPIGIGIAANHGLLPRELAAFVGGPATTATVIPFAKPAETPPAPTAPPADGPS